MMATLDNIMIIPFLRALDKSDPKEINTSQDKFEELAIEYMEADKDAPNNFDKRLKVIEDKIFIVTRCLYVLSKLIADEDMILVLRDNGYKIERDTYFQDIGKVMKDLDVMKFRRDNLKDKMPKKAKGKNKKKESIFGILTGLSTGLEMNLDFQTMCVNEFISWRKQLSRKYKAITKNKPNKNGRKQR